jgi:hypothetical protein
MHLSVNALMLKMATHASGVACWLTVVYGPRGDRYKMEFIQELRTLHSSRVGLWLLGGDFNLTYRAHDKNNGRLNMLSELELFKIQLQGRLYTWSNERQHPTPLSLIGHSSVCNGCTCSPS